jgi:ubiquinone/menaquinone biosynthesis C-methylase UbiE
VRRVRKRVEWKTMNEAQRKEWLGKHGKEVLERVGIREGCVVLDFGCGSGTYTIPAARLAGSRGRVYALDKDKVALGGLGRRALKEGLRNIQTILSSDLATGLGNECVDVVLLHDVIHLIDERAVLFEKVYEVLKPDGQVSVYPMHIDSDEVSRQMRESGFSLAAEEYEGSILVFRKANGRRC